MLSKVRKARPEDLVTSEDIISCLHLPESRDYVWSDGWFKMAGKWNMEWGYGLSAKGWV